MAGEHVVREDVRELDGAQDVRESPLARLCEFSVPIEEFLNPGGELSHEDGIGLPQAMRALSGKSRFSYFLIGKRVRLSDPGSVSRIANSTGFYGRDNGYSVSFGTLCDLAKLPDNSRVPLVFFDLQGNLLLRPPRNEEYTSAEVKVTKNYLSGNLSVNTQMARYLSGVLDAKHKEVSGAREVLVGENSRKLGPEMIRELKTVRLGTKLKSRLGRILQPLSIVPAFLVFPTKIEDGVNYKDIFEAHARRTYPGRYK